MEAFMMHGFGEFVAVGGRFGSGSLGGADRLARA
jgi:hypothetical protein